MKKIVLSFIMILIGVFAFTQSSFEVKSLGSLYSIEQITSAFSTSDFCGAHFNSKRNILVLVDGTIVELKSKTELEAVGINFPLSCFMNDNDTYYKAIWSIGEKGTLLKGYNTELYSSEKEYKHYNQEEQ